MGWKENMYSFEEYIDIINLQYSKEEWFGCSQEYNDTYPHQRAPGRKTFEAVER